MKTKTYYKVLRPNRRSYNSVRPDDGDSVFYPAHEWVSPNIERTPLFVFADWHSAEKYRALGGSHYIVVRCHIIKWRGRKFSKINPMGMQGYSRKSFANAMKNARVPIPEGTVLASKVFCIE